MLPGKRAFGQIVCKHAQLMLSLRELRIRIHINFIIFQSYEP